MGCVNLTETGLLTIAGLIAGTFLKMLHDLLQSCRDSRCKRLKFCGVQCENEILTGAELIDLQQNDEATATQQVNQQLNV